MKRKKENKYLIGRCENYEPIYDYKRVIKDLFLLVVLKRIRIYTKDFYEVMYQRFTIAHYDYIGWLKYYNGNWGDLADDLDFSHLCFSSKDYKTIKLYKAAIRMLRKYRARYI